MATVKKGAKIDFYKFVDPNAGASTTSRANARGGNKELTSVIKQNTRAINSMGRVVNSIGSTVVSIKDVQMKLLKIDEERLKKASFVPRYTTRKKPGPLKGFDSLFKGKIKGFWESILGLASSFLKFFLVLPALKWLSDPENQDKVVLGVKIFAKVLKFLADFTKFSFVNTVEGLYDLLRDDATWMERIGGFVRALTGLGTAWVGISLLANPIGTVTAFKNVLVYFATGLKTAALSLAKHPLVAGALAIGALSFASYELVGKKLQKADEERIDVQVKKLEDEGYDAGQINEILQGGIEDVGGSGSRYTPNFGPNPTAIPGDFDYIPNRLSRGGFLEGFAKGGWISGPQSGYPVSLDGVKPDFIGHGTEYVARKGDDAFIVPFDTPATKGNKGLTEQRMFEAKSLGFFDKGGSYDKFARRMIKIHEGFSPKAKPDAGGMSIGYGHFIKPGEKFPPKISRAFANKLFNEDYEFHKRAAMNIPGFGVSSPMQKAGLIDLTYNMGPGWVKGFPNFMAAYAKGNYETAGNELKDSMWYDQVGRRGPTIVNLMKNKGLGDGIGEYLLKRGLIVPKEQSTLDQIMSNISSGIASFLGMGSPAAAATLDGKKLNENRRDALESANKTESYKVVPTSHKETGSGWGIEGVTDAHGRPLVFSQPAAQQFAAMMAASNGMVKGSDVASSGRSKTQNAAVDGHKNSVHLYGEGVDISGSSNTWMKNNASRFGWDYGYSHGSGSGHYDFKGKGAGETPILGRPGTGSYSFMDIKKENSGRKLVASSSLSGMKLFDGNSGARNFDGMFSSGVFGDMGDFLGGSNYEPNIFNSQNKSRFAQNNQEASKVKKVTEQRNQARREINAKTSEIVQMALAAVESQNGTNRQFIQTAESAIRQLLGAQQGGGTFANVGGTTGTVLRTAVAVLNSFNNPLRGIFQ